MAVTDIVDIGGVQPQSAPVMGRDCSFPITDLIHRCPPDEVLGNIPIMIGAWEDGTVAPSITDYEDQVDTADAADDCEVPELRTTIESCELIAPDMQEIGIKSPQINWKQLRVQFCKQRNIAPNRLCIFNSDGSLNEGEPLIYDFIRFSMDRLSAYIAKQLTRSTMIGDAANVNEFDGLYNQLANGWTQPGEDPCDDRYNIANEIAWDVLVGTPGVNAGPDAVTVAGQQITLWGVAYDVPEGINFAQLLEDVLLDAVSINHADARGGVDMWEMHIPWGSLSCIKNTVACMRMCKTCGASDECSARFEDIAMMERYKRLMSGNMLELQPSGKTVAAMQTRFVDDGELWIGPGSIGGRPSYVLFLDDIERYLSDLDGLSDTGTGRLPGSEGDLSRMLTPQVADVLELASTLEDRALYYAVIRSTIKCLRLYLMLCAGLLVCNRHLWTHVTGLECGCVPIIPCDDNLVDVTEVV